MAGLGQLAILANPVTDKRNGIKPAHILLLQEIYGIALAFGEQCDQHICASNHILARALHVKNGALDYTLEPACRRRVDLAFDTQAFQLSVQVSDNDV